MRNGLESARMSDINVSTATGHAGLQEIAVETCDVSVIVETGEDRFERILGANDLHSVKC